MRVEERRTLPTDHILVNVSTDMRRRSTNMKHHRGGRLSIPDREAVLAFLAKAGRPRTVEHIAAGLGVRGGDALSALEKRMRAMVRDGQVIQNRREGYGLVERMDLIVGRVHGHPDGYGFLIPDADTGGDLYLSAQQMRSLLHGDRAAVRMSGYDRHGRREGALVEVLERANTRVVGRFFLEGNIGFVTPDNRRIHQDVLIPSEARGEARSGQFVLAELVQQPTPHRQPTGRIVEVIGDHAAPGMASEIAIRAFELPYLWPAAVDAEIAELDPHAPPASRGRLDLRKLPFVTIDGEDARDFDDAVYCERHGKGWQLMVAIADVSHYVKPGSALDEAARERGTSVYFPDRVIPMLPEVLSNELCSLKPDVDRLTLVCQMRIGKGGAVKEARFAEAVIRSTARLTYTQVAEAVVQRSGPARHVLAPLVPHLDDLYELFRLMHDRRRLQAVLDFDAQESRVEFDDRGRIRAIRELERNDAHRLIEEFMLAANVAAAELLLEREVPALYRNHEHPKPEKLETLREFLREVGLTIGGGDRPETAEYARLMERIRDREDAHLIQTVLLRSMPLAVYGEKNLGHFGLDFPAYAHFTSPIRRYPDLIVHRAIRRAIGRKPHYPYDNAELHRLGEHCSMTERRADEATRDAMQRLKCEFMRDKVGEVYEGRITGVTAFGLFVELQGLAVEGLAHVTSLPSDYYHFDPVRHELKGERRRISYRLAGKVTARVMRVDVDEKKIDFELVEESSRKPERDRGRGKHRRGRR
jgi:ribonuclease R